MKRRKDRSIRKGILIISFKVTSFDLSKNDYT